MNSLQSLLSAEIISTIISSLTPYSHDVLWHKLMHYKDQTSTVNATEFFISPTGKTDPKSELIENVKLFLQDKNYPCHFPARSAYLREKIQTIQPNRALEPEPLCPELNDWKNKLQARSLTLLFSAAYPNTPASLFGHTFLRLNSTDQNRPELLDYGVNFSAQTDGNDVAVIYALKGLFGGYSGYFSIAPFYTKVNEYTFAESRDLWEYELKLTPIELNRFLDHLWELSVHSKFNYYYLDENCSYQLLSLLEVARPEFDLTSFPFGYITPLETLRKFIETVPVNSIRYRPSLRTKIEKELGQLSQTEKNIFNHILNEKKISELEINKPEINIKDSSSKLKILNAVNHTLFYTKQRNKGKLSQEESSLLRDSLLLRSKNQSQDTQESSNHYTSPPEHLRPELGHKPYRISLAGGLFQNKTLSQLEFRFAIHDLLNNEAGYIPWSSIEIGKLSLYRFGNDFAGDWLPRLDIVHTYSLVPFSLFEKPLSWKFHLGHRRLHPFAIEGGIGVTLYTAGNTEEEKKQILYALVGASVFSHYASGAFAGPLLEIGWISKPITPVFFNQIIYTQVKYEAVLDIIKHKNTLPFSRFTQELNFNFVWMFKKNQELRTQFGMIQDTVLSPVVRPEFTFRYSLYF